MLILSPHSGGNDLAAYLPLGCHYHTGDVSDQRAIPDFAHTA
ncbi:hypothetical protein [Vibrio coralliilyticus]|nr:hypothetical protein [Vibrio coralliilyticus]